MANYHMEIQVVSRGKGRSLTKLANYISGQKLHDDYLNRTYYNRRQDVLYFQIFQPSNAPSCFCKLQYLCDEIDQAEKRYDARTAREFKGSLPNELPLQELIHIVSEYIDTNFVQHGLCAIVAIHEGRNDIDPSKNNPHAHIIVPTREVGPNGFNKKKDREHDKEKYIGIWREQWAVVQNRAYGRNGLNIQVSHKSLEMQGECDREPTIHLSRIDWQREQMGDRTLSGNRKHSIKLYNREHDRKNQQMQDRRLEVDLSR